MRQVTTMSRKPKARQQLDASVNEITRVTRRVDMPAPGSPGSPGINLSVSMSDFKSLAISEIRSRLLAAREAAENLVKAAINDHSEAEAGLKKAAAVAISSFEFSPATVALLNALNAFEAAKTEDRVLKVYTLKLRKRNYYRSSYSKDNDAEPVIDIESKTILAESVFSEKDNESIDELEVDVTIPFTAAMLEWIERLGEIKIQGDNARRDLSDVNRQLAELSHKGDQIQSALTRAHLNGHLNQTTDILSLIEKSVDCLRLPPAVVARLALPAPDERE